MQASCAGPLASYNSLTDEHLAEHFSNPRVFKHLRRMGLITRDGRIVDEGIIRVNNARKEHKARSKGVLATSIINRAIEIERKRRGELKKKLELLEKYEIVEKVKSQKLHPAGIQEFNPYRTVPPPPPRLSRTLDMHFDQLSLSLDQISDMKHLVGKITRGKSIPPHHAKSPYEEELSSRYSTPVPRPPSTPRPSTARDVRGRRSTIRSRPSTAPAGAGMGPRQDTQRQILTKSQPMHSNVSITLKFIGTGLHLGKYAMESSLSDVMVVQQHCGGNTVTLYRGKVKPKGIFTFVSKRHIGMPFGLTIYLDGMMDSRVSACCEYRHQCGMLLGSKTAHFKLVKVEGGKPCYRCEIELNKRYLKERQDREIEMVLGETSSIQELVSPQESANRDEKPPAIDNSPVHSTSPTSQTDVDQLEHCESDTLRQVHSQQGDTEEKASLASHSNASIASVKSKSSRVSVTSSKSSVHSRESVASKTSSRSRKSSTTSLPNHHPSSSHSLEKVDSSEFPATSNNSLTQSGSIILNKDDNIEPETADADTQYNYEEDNFEEPEEDDSEEVQQSKQQPVAEDTDPDLKDGKELSGSDPAKELNTEEPTHQTEKQFDGTDPTLNKEKHFMSDKKPDDGADADHSAEYNYEDDKFEETDLKETDEPRQQPGEHSEDTNPVVTETPPSPSEMAAEGSKEIIAGETSAPVEGSEGKESSVENKNANDADVTTGSNDAEVNRVPSRQSSSSDGANAKEMVNPESDKETPNIKELHGSKAGSEEVKDGGVSEGQIQAPATSSDTQEAQIESSDLADMSEEQLPQGILLSSNRRKSTTLSVSFEAASEEGKQQEGVRDEQQPTKDMSASLTIEEAKKMLQKSQSTASLGSLLNEKESTPVESELDLSGSEDEDIPDLEQKISDLIDEDSSQTGNNTESQNDAEAGEENVDSTGSEDKVESPKAATPQPASAGEKETAGAKELSELQESENEIAGAEQKSELLKGAETAMVPESEKETARAEERPGLQEGTETDSVQGSEKETAGAEQKSELDKGTETAMVPESEKETAGAGEKAMDAETAVTLENKKESIEQPGEETKREGQDKIPTSSQTEIAKKVANQAVTVENYDQGQDIPAINSLTETVNKELMETHDQEATVKEQDTPPANSQTETAKEAEMNREDKAGISAEGEREGEPELASVPAESADIDDVGSVKSGLSSSSSKSSLTSVSSQGSQKS